MSKRKPWLLNEMLDEKDAEIARLREALEQIAEWHWPASEYRYGSDEIVDIATKALRGESGDE